MPWRESIEPVRMSRVAILAPAENLRDVLVEVAGRGTTELEVAAEAGAGPATRTLARVALAEGAEPHLARSAPDLDALAAAGRADLIAGEAQLEERCAAAVSRGSVAGVLGWAPTEDVPGLVEALSPYGGAVVPLATPRGVDPPSLLHSKGRLNRSLAPLVDTYATVPYDDLDPTVVAGAGVRGDVRDDVRRRRARPAPAGRRPAAASGPARAAVRAAPGLAVRRRLRSDGDRLRRPLRRVLRPDRRASGAVGQAAGGPDPAARGRHRRGRLPAGRRLRARAR